MVRVVSGKVLEANGHHNFMTTLTKFKLTVILFCIFLFSNTLISFTEKRELFWISNILSLLYYINPILFGFILEYFANIKYALFLSALIILYCSIYGYFFQDPKWPGHSGFGVYLYVGIFSAVLCVIGAFIGQFVRKKKQKND